MEPPNVTWDGSRLWLVDEHFVIVIALLLT
jgi:hypothetical protein